MEVKEKYITNLNKISSFKSDKKPTERIEDLILATLISIDEHLEKIEEKL